MVMAVRTILTIEQPVLRAKAKKVSRFDAYLERLVADLWETMREAPGVGLAAPQVGESLRVLVAEFEDEQVTLVNPEIIKRSEEIETGTEGCLSIPEFRESVSRARKVTIRAQDIHGKWFEKMDSRPVDKGMHCVQAQTVNVKIAHPHQRVIAEESPDHVRSRALEIDRTTPWSLVRMDQIRTIF